MAAITIAQIEKRLQQLSPDKLPVVFDFVSYLAERAEEQELFGLALTSQEILRELWDGPEEEEAWAYLQKGTL